MKAISAPLVSLALAIPLAGGLIQRAGLPPTSPITNNSAATTATIVAAANVFLATLSDAERSKATFAFNSSQRTGWSNLPTGFFQRNGLRFGDLTQRQKDAALALVAAALSREGYQKVTNIMNGDQVLRNRGSGTGKLQFGLNEYYIALLGSPSTASPWMIQFGGHHLAINITIAGANQVMTPSLPAAQPGSYTLNGQIIRPRSRSKRF
jgi:hypothetical protein